MAFGILGLNSLLQPSSSLVVHRTFANKSKETKMETFEVVESFTVDSLSQPDFDSGVLKVRSTYPTLAVNNFFLTTISRKHGLLKRFYYLKFLSANDTYVYGLYSRFDCSLVAVKTSRSVIFVKGKTDEYKAVAKVMVDKENVDPQSISYQNFVLNSEKVNYSRIDMVKAVRFVSEGIAPNKFEFFVQNLSRLQGFGVRSAVFPDWQLFMGNVFAHGQAGEPSVRMIGVVKKWAELSEFVLTGGKKSLNLCGVCVTQKNISGYVTLTNGRAEPLVANPWEGKSISQRKRGFCTMVEAPLPRLVVKNPLARLVVKNRGYLKFFCR